jgi:hypothetical protein
MIKQAETPEKRLRIGISTLKHQIPKEVDK